MLNVQVFNPYNHQNNSINFEGSPAKLLSKIKKFKGKISGFSLSFKEGVKVLEHAGYEVSAAKGTHFNVKKDSKFLFQIAASDGSQLKPAQKQKIIKLLRDNVVNRVY